MVKSNYHIDFYKWGIKKEQFHEEGIRPSGLVPFFSLSTSAYYNRKSIIKLIRHHHKRL